MNEMMNRVDQKERNMDVNPYEAIQGILKAIENFSENSEVCYEKSGNDHFGCAMDLVGGIDASLIIVEVSRKNGGYFSENVYEKFKQYKKEVDDIGARISEVRGVNNERSYLVLEELDLFAKKLESFIREVLKESHN